MVNSLIEIRDITFSPYSSIDNSINEIFPNNITQNSNKTTNRVDSRTFTHWTDL